MNYYKSLKTQFMSKQLTPMQEAKKQIAELWSSPSDQPTYSQIFKILDEQELKEKQVIEDAYDDGFENYRDASIGSDDDIIESQDYYNNKFKND